VGIRIRKRIMEAQEGIGGGGVEGSGVGGGGIGVRSG